MYAIESRMTGEFLTDAHGRLVTYWHPDNAGRHIHKYTKFPAEWKIIYIGS